MKIFCIGNEDVPEDRIALDMADTLKIEGIEFLKIHSVDDFLDKAEGISDIIVMDVVKGIDKITLIEDIDMIKERKLSTMHDFDIGYMLKLKKELGEIDKIKIIGLPKDASSSQLKEMITRLKT